MLAGHGALCTFCAGTRQGPRASGFASPDLSPVDVAALYRSVPVLARWWDREFESAFLQQRGRRELALEVSRSEFRSRSIGPILAGAAPAAGRIAFNKHGIFRHYPELAR